MPDITAEKPGKVFMITVKSYKQALQFFIFAGMALLMITCQPDLSDDPIPVATFSPFTFNVNLPEYQDLRTKGYKEFNSLGVRGIILHRIDASTYHAYERNCSYQPNSSCATVNVHISGLYMEDPCCKSNFDFATGNPNGGPAWRPLRQYDVIVSATEITITDTIVN
jgi:nitrite reductase/ring-hydroxylating ferredoxin subunit